MNQINIEIAYALPERYYLKSFQVDEGITVQTAITQSGILSQFPDIDLSTNKIGIFSRPIKLTDVLKKGDRIEIYRPLLADPKEIRRKRAAEQAKAAQAANKPFEVAYLEQVQRITDDCDMPDESRARLLRELGLLLVEKNPEQALAYLERALGLDQKIGVKGDIKKLRKQLNKADE